MRVQGGLSTVLVAAALMVAPAAASAAAVYAVDPDGTSCVNRGEIGRQLDNTGLVEHAGIRYAIWTRGGHRELGQAIEDQVARSLIPLAEHFGGGRQQAATPLTGGTDRIRLLFLPDSAFPAWRGGQTTKYCDAGSDEPVIVARDAPIGAARRTAVHELAHVFHMGVVGRRVTPEWLGEAVAEHATGEVAETPGLLERAARRFVDKLGQPLDETAGAHEYGAMLFMRHLQHRLGEGFPAFLERLLLRLQDEQDPVAGTRILAETLAERAITLDDELLVFWRDQFLPPSRRPSATRTGRPPRLARWETLQTPGTETHEVAAVHRAAADATWVKLVAPLRQVTVTVPAADGPGQAYLLAGDELLPAAAEPRTLRFCVGEVAEGAHAWPAEGMKLITVNPATAPDAAATPPFRVQFASSEEPCVAGDQTRPPEDGEGDGGAALMPRRCPGLPRIPSDGRGTNRAWKSLYRLSQIFGDMQEWQAAVVARYGSGAYVARQPPILRCAAARADRIRALPGPGGREPDRFATAARQAARHLAKALRPRTDDRRRHFRRAARATLAQLNAYERMVTLKGKSACASWRTANDEPAGCGDVVLSIGVTQMERRRR